MKITQAVAKEVTKELLKQKVEHFNKEKSALDKMVASICESVIPKDVIKALKNHGGYFAYRSSFVYQPNVYGDKLALKSLYMPDIPRCNHRDMSLDDIPEKFKKKISDEISRLILLHNEINKKQEEIYQVILSMSTYKRLEEEFPEAYKKVPAHVFQSSGNLPVKNLSEIKAFIK